MNQNTSKSRFPGSARLLPFALSTLMCAIQAQAQEATEAPPAPPAAPSESAGATVTPTPADATEAGIDEIVVTAQRKDESLSKVPVAVSVIEPDTLAKAQIVSEQDLRFATPGLSVRSSLSSNQLNYAMRGQSQDAFSGTRPGVLPYINEVQIGGVGGSTAFYDLASVQVLKGPQGTLFGRSATGGAVLFTTAKPTDEFGGYASGLTGNHGALKLEAAVSGPIVPGLLTGRLAGFSQKRKGFQHNAFDGGLEGDIDRNGVRASLTAKGDGSLRNDLVVDYFHADDESMVGILSGLLPFTGAPGQPPFIPIEFLYAGVATEQARQTGIGTLQAFTGASTEAATAFYDAYFANPLHPTGGIRSLLPGQRPYKVNINSNNISRAKNVVVTNATSFDVTEDVQIKNIIGFTHLDSLAAFDADGTPYAISGSGARGTETGIDNVTKQFSDELQLLGNAFDSRLSYVTGLYYLDEKSTTHQSSQFFDLLFGGPTQHNDYKLTDKTYAAYAQGTYQLNDSGLGATVGTRYTSEKVGKIVFPTDSVRVALGDPAPDGFSYDQSRTYKKLSWHFGLQEQLDPNTLLYVNSRRAYKSGGYNGTVAPKVGPSDIAGDGYGAERVTDVELGAKFRGHLGEWPTRLSAAAYHDWLDESQRTAFSLVLGNPASLTVNVPKGKVYGLELEGVVIPLDNVTVGGTFNYTHASYSSDPVVANGSSQVFDQVPDTPKYSGTVFSELRVPVAGALEGILHAEMYAQAKTYTTPRSENSLGTTMPGYGLANFRIGIEDNAKGWSLTANLKNAFDREYYVGGIPTGEIYQINTLVPGDPRTVTLEARFKF